MNMMADIAVEQESKQLMKIIQDMKAIGKTDTEILDYIERRLNLTIEECKTGWR